MPRGRRPVTTTRRVVLRAEADRMAMRDIVDFFGVWAWCYRRCRRQKGCASPTVVCFDHNIATARKILHDIANWRRLDGPRQPEDLLDPVKPEDLFD
jgi:hypothetical protein